MKQPKKTPPLSPSGPDPLSCSSGERRQEIRRSSDWNGIDYVEVADDEGMLLVIYFIDSIPEGLEIENILILGGRRITGIRVLEIEVCDASDPRQDDCLRVRLDRAGDFSTYTLCLVAVDEHGKPVVDENEEDGSGDRKIRKYRPYPGIDPRYACAEFAFRVNCASDQDCQPADECPVTDLPAVDINYLAKDYASFRQLMFDRLSLTMPGWRERHVPDIGVTLVELMAYAGDYLSYYQDAVATEAYFDTARRRVSVRRHARLVDYVMHEGLNARAWVALTVDAEELPLPLDSFFFITAYSQQISAPRVVPAEMLRDLPGGSFEVFEPIPVPGVEEVILRRAHNRINIYTWGDELCCLPKGATTATLVDGRWVPYQPSPDDPKQEQSRQAPTRLLRATAESAVTYERQGKGGRKGNRPAARPARGRERKKYEEEPPRGEYVRELDLRVGDYLLFQEVTSPTTGLAADADPAHRHVVRITRTQQRVDELYHVPLLEIEWSAEDALPFALCISATGQPPECLRIVNASVAIANLVLVDHGRTQPEEPLGVVPLKSSQPECDDGCAAPPVNIPGRFRPRLERPGLTYSDPLPGLTRASEQPPAARLLLRSPRAAVPQLWLRGVLPRADGAGPLFDLRHPTSDWQGPTGSLDDLVVKWEARPDLLASDDIDRHFMVEMDNERRAWLRFGNGTPAGMAFYARYRTGSGESGNIGADTLTVMVLDGITLDGVTIEVTNPLPAWGGTEPEPLSQVRLLAPYTFRGERLRAVTADDYAELVMRGFKGKLQRAAARLQWTGSFYEACVVVDPLGNSELADDDPLLDEIRDWLMDYRRMGHDLVVKPARYVPVHLALRVCVLPGFLRGHLKTALLDRFSNRRRAGSGDPGEVGFFHPDALTFGQGIALSQVVAAARDLPGVESVTVERLERYGSPSRSALEGGLLALDLFEIARLDNDPNQPENGRFELTLEGGR